MKRFFVCLVALLLCATSCPPVIASDPPGPAIDGVVVSGAQKGLRVSPFPGAQAYYFYTATNPNSPFTLNTNFFLAPYVTGYSTNQTTNGFVVLTNLAYEWRITNFTGNSGFFKVAATPMSSNTMSAATVLNRLAYGPTPDDLELYGSNPQAYIDQQLNMNGIAETMDNYTIEVTNSIPSDATTNWTFVQIKGVMNTSNLYMFLTAPGDVYVDDVSLIEGTNGIANPNMLVNGDFESALTTAWVQTGATGTHITNEVAHSGNGCLHLISGVAGSTSVNNLKNAFPATLTNNAPVTLSYWYLPSPTSSKLKIQVGTGSQLISSAGGIPATPQWVYARATGKANGTGRIYFFLSGAGTCYLDDIKLVSGTTPDVGVNLVANGDFETGTTNSWSFAARYVTNSVINSSKAHGGNYSLQLVGTSGGSASTSQSLYQNISLVSNQTYTISYWYLPATPGINLTAQLDGAGALSTPDVDIPGLNRRMNTLQAAIGDYRAWFCLHAVTSQRQLFEILSQFLENHFVTQYTKSRDYLQGLGFDGTVAGWIATDWEWREMLKWRNAMLNPNCTFYDLLRISAESPAMIVYLDSVNSKGNNANVANENYARELLELFTFGVDNGYDQNDIILMSRAWTGWSVELVDTENAYNPFAPASVTFSPNTNSSSKANTIGSWAFNYKAGSHGTNRGALFAGKTVPARFGPPWAGNNYQLNIPSRLTSDTNSIQDGYDVIRHLADQPFTQEYISVKLCRLFVHDEFPNPTTIAESPEYSFYDYTDPNRSAEAELVHQCMLAWDNSSPKGNIRAVLNVIFNSDLFRSHTAQAQKVKTPLEFVISSIRALRSTSTSGALTANTDGYAVATPLSRMGGMNLFDRDAPDGYPETGPNWISAGTLVERMRFVQSYCILFGQTGHNNSSSDAGNNVCDPVALLKAKLTPASKWDNAGDVADYFLGLLYPGEGSANLALYRTAAINFLNSSDNGTASSPFNGLGNTTSNYDTRVRGLVAMLMTMKRFQEQ